MGLGDAEKGPVAEGESHRKGHGEASGMKAGSYLLSLPCINTFFPLSNPGNPWGKQGRMLDACETTAS